MTDRLAREVGRQLREVAEGPRWSGYEEYDEQGEVRRVSEFPPMRGGPPLVVLVSGTGYAEPRTDWRERGVVPREGWWREGVRIR